MTPEELREMAMPPEHAWLYKSAVSQGVRQKPKSLVESGEARLSHLIGIFYLSLPCLSLIYIM